MPYSLVFSDASDRLPGKRGMGEKDIGENVLFADLPAAYKVFAFYYPGDMTDPALETALRNLAAATGQNLFVNIGRLNDPQLDKIARRFEIEEYPVLIMTADPSLASAEGETESAYVRLDDKHLLKSPERTVQTVTALFNLFLQGKVAEALASAKGRQRSEKIRMVTDFFAGSLRHVGNFVQSLELSYSFIEGSLSLKASRSAEA